MDLYLNKHLMQYLNTDLPLYLDLVLVAALHRQGLDYMLDKNLKTPGADTTLGMNDQLRSSQHSSSVQPCEKRGLVLRQSQ